VNTAGTYPPARNERADFLEERLPLESGRLTAKNDPKQPDDPHEVHWLLSV